MKTRRNNLGDVRDRTDSVIRNDVTRRTFGTNNSATNFANGSTSNVGTNFANELRDRLDRTRAVISWIEDNAPRIAAGWRLVVSILNVWNTVENLHLRFA